MNLELDLLHFAYCAKRANFQRL